MFLRKVDKSFPNQTILDLQNGENYIKNDNSIVNVNVNNDLYNGCIIPMDQAHFLCIISCINFITFLYGFKQRLFYLSICPLAVFFTSINYWHKPVYGWRRNVDIICIFIALSTNILHSIKAQNGLLYRCITTIALLFYPISWYLFNNKYVWTSTIAHSMIHIVANIANVILYSGVVPPLSIW